MPVHVIICETQIRSLFQSQVSIVSVWKWRKLTLFGVTLAHALAAAASALDRAEDAVHVGCAAPLLVGENVDAELLFTRLDEADVGEHTLVLECAGQLGGDGGVGVEAGQGDQLEDEPRNVS